MPSSRKKQKFLAHFEDNYSKCLGYVTSIVEDQTVARKIIIEAMERLWDEYAAGEMKDLKVRSLVSALDDGIRKYSNIYKRGISSVHYDEEDLQNLPPKRRMIFMMSRIDKMQSSDIAARLGISKRTVDKHLELAVKQLKNEI